MSFDGTCVKLRGNMEFMKVITPKDMPIPKKLKKLVIDSIKRHAWNIGVSHFKVDIFYMEKDAQAQNGDHILATATVDRRYLSVTFRIYPHAVKHWKSDGDKEMERIIAHEVAHCATQHLYDVATARYCDDGEMKDAHETLTEVIGKLSLNLDDYKQRVHK